MLINSGYQMYGIAINHDLTRLVGLEKSGVIHIINIEDPSEPKEIAKKDIGIRYVVNSFKAQFTPDQKHIVMGNNQGQLLIFDSLNGIMAEPVKEGRGDLSYTINPNGKTIYTLSEYARGIEYDIKSESSKTFLWGWDKDLTPSLKEWYSDRDRSVRTLNSIKFISDKYIILTGYGFGKTFLYLLLYELKHYSNKKINDTIYQENKAIDALKLIKHPNVKWPYQEGHYPATYSPGLMDTAPNKNILVMAMDDASGIMVYHFDPDTFYLKLIWESDLF